MKLFMKLFAAMSFAAMFSLSACEQAEEKLEPVLSVTTEGDILVPEVGGTYSFTYSVENPVEGAVVTADAGEASWISGINTSEDGTVSFTVDQNEEEAERNAEITVCYTYDSGEQTATVKVIQSAKGSSPVIVPDQPSIEVPVDGGEMSVTYTLSNPVDGGEFTATSEDEWITGIDYAVEGTVAFSVAANESGELRNGKVILHYAYMGTEVTAEVAVNQSGEMYPDAFVIEVSEILPTTARIKASSAYDDLRWFTAYLTQGELDAVGGKENVEEWCTSYLEENAAGDLDGFLLAGDYDYDVVVENLSFSTHYFTLAVGVDPATGEYLTDFFWGPEFETRPEAITFDVEVTPDTRSVTFSIHPSGEGYYLYQVIDADFAQPEWSDYDIMMELIWDCGSALFTHLVNTEVNDVTIGSLQEETDYQLVVFGVNPNDEKPTTPLKVTDFTTLAPVLEPAVVEGAITHFWAVSDLIAYNPAYSEFAGDKPYVGVVELTSYSDNAAGAYWHTMDGDLTWMVDDLYDTVVEKNNIVYKDDPAFFITCDWSITLFLVGIDAEGNPGKAFAESWYVFEGEQDFELFDQYYNAWKAAQ